MAIKHAAWVHGSSLQVETPQNVKSVTRFGFYTRIVGKPGKGTWIHFPVPTPVIVDAQRLRLESAMIRFNCNSNRVCVAHFHVFDGEQRVFLKDNINLVQNWNTPLHRERIRPEHSVLWGLGITLYVAFNGTTPEENTIDFASVGCDLIV
jgi:hypothetical protein